jgi:lipid-A-disaccharide synthase
MVKKRFMLIAGEASGDKLAAALVRCLREKTDRESSLETDSQPLRASLDPEFFGAGGPEMAAAGVRLSFDLTRQAVVGLWEVAANLWKFKRLFQQLVQLASERQPHAIICVDFSGFNLRFARAIQRRVRSLEGTFSNWRPVLVQYVSPQVWASRSGRARWLEENCDLLLTIFPFEHEWYASRAPLLRVEFVGHPMMDRSETEHAPGAKMVAARPAGMETVVLLPGSRSGELQRHLPVMLQALEKIRSARPEVRAIMVLPDEHLVRQAMATGLPPGLETRRGGLDEALAEADLAIACSGTVTLECAWFGVPTVAIYMTSWATYQVAKRIVKVPYLAMPNLLAREAIYPEFIQEAASPGNIARAALELLNDPARRSFVRSKLAKTVASLGPPGASGRAAQAILNLLERAPIQLRASLRGSRR